MSFPPSVLTSNTMSISVSAIADNLVEGNETVTVSVSSVSLNQQMGTTQPLNVVIQDINGKYHVIEGGGRLHGSYNAWWRK